MPINSILRIDDDASPVCLYTYDAQNHSCTNDEIKLWSDDRLLNKDLIILVPASWVYHSQTQVASKNLEILSKSIPFAIEEELSNDVDDNYYAFQLNEDGTQNVIAIEKKYLDDLNQKIINHQLNVNAIYSEISWLPKEVDAVCIWTDQESSLMSIGDSQVMRVSNHQISQMLPVFAQDMSRIICNMKSAIDYSELPIEARLNEINCCQYLIDHSAINLYVDELKINHNNKPRSSSPQLFWLVGILLVSWVVIQFIQWNSLRQSIDEITLKQKELFKQHFSDPAAVELVDPFAAMQSRLKIQNAQSPVGQNILIDAIDQLGKTLQKQPMVKLNGLRMVDQKIELQIAAPNMTVINNFHQLLQQNAFKFTVQIGVNELGDDQIFKSIITMVPR